MGHKPPPSQILSMSILTDLCCKTFNDRMIVSCFSLLCLCFQLFEQITGSVFFLGEGQSYCFTANLSQFFDTIYQISVYIKGRRSYVKTAKRNCLVLKFEFTVSFFWILSALSTAAPISPSARRAPFRPASPRRRRKHRKRISKAAIRAMIM